MRIAGSGAMGAGYGRASRTRLNGVSVARRNWVNPPWLATSLTGDPDHPITRGGLCAKVDHYLADRVYHPDRLLHPLRRVGPKGSGEFERVGLDEALDDIAARLRGIVTADGPTAVLPYSYMGAQGLIQGMSMDRRFFARLGATRLLRGICGLTGSSGVSVTNGTSNGVLPEDLVHSRFIVLWGTNTLVTNLHLWPFIRQPGTPAQPSWWSTHCAPAPRAPPTGTCARCRAPTRRWRWG